MNRAPETDTPRRATGAPWFLLVPRTDDRHGPPGSGEHVADRGGWRLSTHGSASPEGLELRDDGWTYRARPFGHAAAWYAADDRGRIVALGSHAADVARAAGAGIDETALLDDLLLGFRTDGRSAFGRVLPCGSARALEYSPDGIRRMEDDSGPDLDALARRIARAMDDGACIELTGGVDSRLLMALGVSAGGKPSAAFTIGSDQDPDVIVARQIAELLGMEHRALTVRMEADRLPDDARAFVAESGFVCNAAAYGWLPSVFRALAPWRTAQLSGVGGEIGEGFYYSGFDGLFQRLNSPRLWMRARVVVDGGRWAGLFEPGIFWDRLRTVARETACLRAPGAWRQRTDAFYTDARIHGWAIPVIRASAAWYEPITPFLSAEYLAWARGLDAAEMASRAAQLDLIGRLSPELAALPYAKQLGGARSGGLSRKLAKVRKLAGRVLPGPTQQPEQWRQAAESLMRTLDGADSVVDRLRLLPGVRADGVARALRENPATSAHVIGALLTMAMGIEEHAKAPDSATHA